MEKTELERVLEQRIETLSKGFKRRVGIAQAILHDPQVLIMDEPTDGLDPNQKHHVRKLITEMAETRPSSSRRISSRRWRPCARAPSSSTEGRIVADGTAEDLMRRLPYHDAIALKVAADRAEAVTKVLAEFAAIAKVETDRLGERAGAAARRAGQGRTGLAGAGSADPWPADRG